MSLYEPDRWPTLLDSLIARANRTKLRKLAALLTQAQLRSNSAKPRQRRPEPRDAQSQKAGPVNLDRVRLLLRNNWMQDGSFRYLEDTTTAQQGFGKEIAEIRQLAIELIDSFVQDLKDGHVVAIDLNGKPIDRRFFDLPATRPILVENAIKRPDGDLIYVLEVRTIPRPNATHQASAAAEREPGAGSSHRRQRRRYVGALEQFMARYKDDILRNISDAGLAREFVRFSERQAAEGKSAPHLPLDRRNIETQVSKIRARRFARGTGPGPKNSN